MADNTLVLFTSDNGPVWYEKDIEKFGHRSVGPLRGSKGSGYEGGHRMPFIVRNPERAQAGTKTDALVSFVDVAATLQDLMGSKAERPKDSISFAPVLRGEAGQRTTLHHGRGKKAWVREGDWKYVPSKGAAGFLKDGEREGDVDHMLFNVREDIGENKNLASEHPEKIARLKTLFKSIP